MKKIANLFLTVAVALFATSAFAQNETAGELFNKAYQTYQSGNELEAVEGFKGALKLAQEMGEDGLEIAENCKELIPQILIGNASKLAKAKDYVGAEKIYAEAIAAAKEYGKTELLSQATEGANQLPFLIGGEAINSGNFTEAIAQFNKAIEIDPHNAKAYLYKGIAEDKAGLGSEAEASLLKAVEFGESSAEKTLSNMFLTKANNALKAKDFATAVAQAEKALNYGENPTASQIAGVAAYNAKNYAKAAQHLKNAKASAQITYMLANSYEQTGNKAQACAQYKKIASDAKFGATAKQKMTKLGC